MLRIFRQMEEWSNSRTLSGKQLTEIQDAIHEYKDSVAKTGDDWFTLPYQWEDKPHRHVYDLCRIIEILISRYCDLSNQQPSQ